MTIGAAYHVIKESLVGFSGLCHARGMKTAIDHRVGVGGFHKAIRLLTWGLAGLGLVLRAAAAAQVNTGRSAGTFRLKSTCLTWGAGNILPAFGGTEPGIGKVHFTPNEPAKALNDDSATQNYELVFLLPGPDGFGRA